MIDLDAPTTYERILRRMEEAGGISQLDCVKVGVTAISQRCNEMRREPQRFERFLKGRRLGVKTVKSNGTHWAEYFIKTN